MKKMNILIIAIIIFVVSGQSKSFAQIIQGSVDLYLEPQNWDFTNYPNQVEIFSDYENYIEHAIFDSAIGEDWSMAVFSLMFTKDPVGQHDTTYISLLPVSLGPTQTGIHGTFSPLGQGCITGEAMNIGVNVDVMGRPIAFELLGRFYSEFQKVPVPGLVTVIDEPFSELKLEIFPNPTHDYVTITSTQATAEIRNSLGQLVKTVPTNQPVYVGDFIAGVYIVNNRQKLLVQ